MELKEWKEAVFKTMLANKIDRFVIEYYGSGDDGGVQEVNAHGATGLIDLNLRRLPKATPDLQYVNNLHDEVIRFADKIISVAGHEGYENGDGGEGTIEVNAINQKVTIQHNHLEMVSRPQEEVTL